MSKLTRLNSLGIYRVSNYKYIVPVKSESIGIIYGYNGNNIKKIMNKFDTTIVLKKASYNQSPYKYPSFIISSNNQINIWDTINHIHYLTTIPPKKKVCYLNTKFDKHNCNHNCNHTCNDWVPIQKLIEKNRVDPEKILNTCASLVEKNTYNFKTLVLAGYIPESALHDNNSAFNWKDYYFKNNDNIPLGLEKIKKYILNNYMCCYCSSPDEPDVFDLCRPCLLVNETNSVLRKLKKDKTSRLYYMNSEPFLNYIY